MVLPSLATPELVANAWRASPAATAERWSRGEWRRAPHLDLLSTRVSRLADGPIRMAASMPFRHGKSEMLSHWTSVWVLANWPHKRVGVAAYGWDFAVKWSQAVRETIRLNPGLGLRVKPGFDRADRWELEEGGGMVAAGVGGRLTGLGFDLLVIDDPIKGFEEANSRRSRDNIWNWYSAVARTRLEPGGSLVIVMTRWHEDDLIGRMGDPEYGAGADHAETWDYIRLPGLAEADDPLGRAEGEALWPERFDEAELARLRVTLGPRSWPGLVQQRPAMEGGQVFHSDWWVRVDELPVLAQERGGMTYQYWDTAFKATERNDYSACVTMALAENGFCLVHVLRKRLEYPQLIRAIREQAELFSPDAVFVEDAASGQSAIQSLRAETRVPVFPGEVTGSKFVRANRVTGMVEAGMVYVPLGAPWLPDFLDEMDAFGSGHRHDDQVDAFSGCLTKLRQASTHSIRL